MTAPRILVVHDEDARSCHSLIIVTAPSNALDMERKAAR